MTKGAEKRDFHTEIEPKGVPKIFRVRKGKLVCFDGSSSVPRLKVWVELAKVSEDTPVCIITSEWYQTLLQALRENAQIKERLKEHYA